MDVTIDCSGAAIGNQLQIGTRIANLTTLGVDEVDGNVTLEAIVEPFPEIDGGMRRGPSDVDTAYQLTLIQTFKRDETYLFASTNLAPLLRGKWQLVIISQDNDLYQASKESSTTLVMKRFSGPRSVAAGTYRIVVKATNCASGITTFGSDCIIACPSPTNIVCSNKQCTQCQYLTWSGSPLGKEEEVINYRPVLKLDNRLSVSIQLDAGARITLSIVNGGQGDVVRFYFDLKNLTAANLTLETFGLFDKFLFENSILQLKPTASLPSGTNGILRFRSDEPIEPRSSNCLPDTTNTYPYYFTITAHVPGVYTFQSCASRS